MILSDSYFARSPHEIGDYTIIHRCFSYFPKKTRTGWIFWKPYYRVVRSNAYYPPRERETLAETLYLEEPDYLIFKLTQV